MQSVSVSIGIIDWWIAGNYLFVCFSINGHMEFEVMAIHD